MFNLENVDLSQKFPFALRESVDRNKYGHYNRLLFTLYERVIRGISSTKITSSLA